MEIVYMDESIIVCVKPAGMLSTDSPGGVPEALRQQLGTENIRTVHRLDAAVSGLMLLARRKKTAADLGKQVMERGLGKEYLAVVHGCPEERSVTLRDYLHRDKAKRMSFVVPEGSPESQEAVLDYEVLGEKRGLSLVRIRLHTGRTHQIRVQFSSRGFPLYGDKKYGLGEDGGIALWSARLQFTHPKTGQEMDISKAPKSVEYPWSEFEKELII